MSEAATKPAPHPSRARIIRRIIETKPTDYSKLTKWSETFQFPATEEELAFFSARPVELDRVRLRCGKQYREYEFEGAEVLNHAVLIHLGDQIIKMT